MSTMSLKHRLGKTATGADCKLVVLCTELGAMGYVESAAGLLRLSIGFARLSDAHDELAAEFPEAQDCEHGDLADLLERYARGEVISFDGVRLDDRELTDFRKQVTTHCRKVPYGETVSYAELARRAGRPQAMRAVGTVMAKNLWPLIVPCHRVVRSDGNMGGFSALQGVPLKKRLLALEAQHRRP